MKRTIMFLITIVSLVILVMASGCTEASDQTYKLYSINALTGSSGSFALGSGSIDEEAYYFYYLQDTDGAYHLMKADAGSSRIFMDTASDTAYVTKVSCIVNSRHKPACGGYVYGYDFHVPPGTITIQFNGNVDRSVNGV
jgi:hypothetical protein